MTGAVVAIVPRSGEMDLDDLDDRSLDLGGFLDASR
jgi:hypothetical protein